MQLRAGGWLVGVGVISRRYGSYILLQAFVVVRSSLGKTSVMGCIVYLSCIMNRGTEPVISVQGV
jgi:hypothetical protein